MDELGTFETEGEIAGVAKQRHFKEVVASDVGDLVDPLDDAVPIPQLPEESADQGGGRVGADDAPVAAPEVV